MKKSLKHKITIILLVITLVPAFAAFFIQVHLYSKDNVELEKKAIIVMQESLETTLYQSGSEVINYLSLFEKNYELQKENKEAISVSMDELLDRTDLISRISYTDKNGVEIASSDDKLFDISDKTYFLEGMDGDLVISEAELGISDHVPTVVIAIPIEASGEIYGVITGSLKLEAWQNICIDAVGNRNMEAIVLDKNGMVLVSSMADLTSFDSGKDMEIFKNPNIAGGVATAYIDENNRETIGIKSDGVRLEMYIITQESMEDVMSTSKKTYTVVVALLIVLVLMLIYVSFKLANYITLPILTMKEKMLNIKAESFIDDESILNRGDELASLANGYNQMVKMIQENQEKIITTNKELSVTSKRLMATQEAGNIGSWEYDVKSDTLWIAENTAKKIGLETWVSGTTLSNSEYNKLYSNVCILTDNGEVNFDYYDNNFVKVFEIDMDNIKEKYQVLYYLNIGKTRKYSQNIAEPIIKNGELIGITGVNYDVTNIKKNEIEQIRTIAKLERTEQIAKSGSWSLDFTTDTYTFGYNVARLFGIENNNTKLKVNEFIDIISGAKVEGDISNSPGNKNITGLELYKLDGIEVDQLKEIYKAYIRTSSDIIYEDTHYPVIENGKLVGMEGIIRDISEQKLAEREIQIANDKFQSAELAGDIGSWEYDVIRDELWLSNNLLKLLGAPNLEVNTFNKESYDRIFRIVNVKIDGEIVHWQKPVNTLLELYKLGVTEYNKNNNYKMTYYSENQDGSYEEYDNKYSLTYEDGNIVSINGIARNVTSETRQRNELIRANEESKRLTSKLLISEEIALCGSWEYNLLINEISFSKNAMKLNEIEIEDDELLLSIDKFKECFQACQIIQEDGELRNVGDYMSEKPIIEMFGIDVSNENSLGQLSKFYDFIYIDNKLNKYIHNYCIPIVENNELIKLIGVMKDITMEVNKENELINSKEIAEEASASQSRFVANMSHEIRTPLNAILGYAEILKSFSQDEKMKYYLSAINSSGNILLDIVTDLLDFSKVNAGKYAANYIPCNISDLLEEIKILFWQKINIKDLDFELVYDVDTPTFVLPVSIVRQIIINFLGNAIKFTNEGSVTIKAICKENKSKYNIDIVVSDTGIGIEDDKKEFIFEAFEQAEESHQKIGTGLGLAISTKFAEIIGGHISLDSEVGVGSSFILHLKDIELSETNVESAYSGNEKIDFEFVSQKIMVVDDIKDNREVFKAHCENLNLAPKTYYSAKDAIKHIEIFRPDLIITDLRMPEMNGEDFAKYVKDKDRNIPIICVTASIDPNERYELQYFDDVLNKPIASSILAKTMAKYLETKKIGSEEKTFTIETAFRDINLTDDELLDVKSRFYEDIKGLKSAMKPKGVKKLAGELTSYGTEVGNETLKNIGEELAHACENSKIMLMIETINSFEEYLGKGD